MKKFLTAILAIFYLTSSTGATIHFHYCMDKLVDWGLTQEKSDKCGKCGTKSANYQKHGCCSDEFKTFKSQDQQMAGTINILFHVFYVASSRQIEAVNLSPTTITNPPSILLFRSRVPIHIFDCVFLI